MKKALVTGGMGFVGNHLVSKLLELGIEVIILDKSICRAIGKDISGAEVIEGDVLSRELLGNLLTQVDTCFHLAAISSLKIANQDWLFSFTNNATAFNGLLQEIRQLKKPIKLIYASSAAVYGKNQKLPLSETSETYPLSTYGADKLSNENYARALYELAGISSIGLRFFNVYGPGQLQSNPYSGVISRFKNAILSHEPLIVFGDGQQTRDFIHVDDVVNALILSEKIKPKGAEICNVCTGVPTSISDLALIMTQLTRHQEATIYQAARPMDIRYSLGLPLQAKKRLGFSAAINLEAGLKDFLGSFNLLEGQ